MIQNLWATPFLSSRIGDNYREEFINHILLNYDLKNPPSDFGAVNVLAVDEPEVQNFKDKVVIPAFNNFLRNTLGREISSWGGYKLHGWLTGSGYDYSINYHNHKGSQLSAVFYLLCDQENCGGRISFTDPRQNANRGYDEFFQPWFKHLSFIPKSGDFVVFPSFLYHYVSTYQGNIRVALPVDLFLYGNN